MGGNRGNWDTKGQPLGDDPILERFATVHQGDPVIKAFLKKHGNGQFEELVQPHLWARLASNFMTFFLFTLATTAVIARCQRCARWNQRWTAVAMAPLLE